MQHYGRIKTPNGPRFAELEGDRALLLDGAPWHGANSTGETLPLREELLSCPLEPSKIVGVGRNFAAHAAELGNKPPSFPLFFFKPPTALLGPDGVVDLPPESERVDYEAEIALVIGRGGRRIPKERALDHVFGFTLACDITARDLQKRDGQWARAKGFDGFCPLGPHVLSGVPPTDLELRLYLNDELRQRGFVRDMIFGFADIVSHTSSFMTLEPGDVILTGTPEGVGPLSRGDHVRLEIPNLCLRFGVS